MKYIIICMFSASLMISSCQEILFGDEEFSREILLEDFHAVEIRGIFNIVLIQDSTDKIVITGKKDIRSIDAFVNSDTLIIHDPVEMSFNIKRNKLEIHFTDLEYLETWNPVNVSNRDTLKANQFIYASIVEVAEVSLVIDCNALVVASANTLGHFNLSGRTDYLFISSAYGCSFLAGDLTCRHVEIIHESIGDVVVNASASITAYIRGPGNIYYHGNPSIEIAEKKGDGRLIKLD